MNESDHVYALLKKNLDPRIQFDRIENAAGSGMPDAVACLDGKERWLEFKIATGANWTIKWRVSQIAWARRAASVYRQAFIVVRKNNEWGFFRTAEVLTLPKTPQKDGKSVSVDLVLCPCKALMKMPLQYKTVQQIIFD